MVENSNNKQQQNKTKTNKQKTTTTKPVTWHSGFTPRCDKGEKSPDCECRYGIYHQRNYLAPDGENREWRLSLSRSVLVPLHGQSLVSARLWIQVQGRHGRENKPSLGSVVSPDGATRERGLLTVNPCHGAYHWGNCVWHRGVIREHRLWRGPRSRPFSTTPLYIQAHLTLCTVNSRKIPTKTVNQCSPK